MNHGNRKNLIWRKQNREDNKRERGFFGSISLGYVTLFVMVCFVGCKGADIKFSTDKTSISAGGCDKALITAVVEIDGTPRSGKTVNFQTTAGSFSATEELTSTVGTTNSEGMATVELFATEAVGTATITADFYDGTYDAEKSITVKFVPPTGKFLPVSDSISLVCETDNIGALRPGNPDIRVPCHFSAQTATGCALPISAFIGVENVLHLRAEAGTLEVGWDDWSGETVLFHSSKGGETSPVDVDPVEGEPSRSGPLGETFNPRDGAVTLMVAVRAREAFTDLNGNGEHDSGEPFDDMGEPFLDVDDNGIFALGTDPWYYDTDGDGEYTGANGTYDATTMAFSSFKMIWSGKLHEHSDTSRYELSGSEDMPNGGSLTVSVFVLDTLMNPVAAFADNSDRIYFDVSGYVNVNPSYGERPMTNVTAMAFDHRGRYLMYNNEDAVYRITLSDDDTSWTYDPPVDWNMIVTVYASPGKDEDDYFLNQDEMSFQNALQGTSK